MLKQLIFSTLHLLSTYKFVHHHFQQGPSNLFILYLSEKLSLSFSNHSNHHVWRVFAVWILEQLATECNFPWKLNFSEEVSWPNIIVEFRTIPSHIRSKNAIDFKFAVLLLHVPLRKLWPVHHCQRQPLQVTNYIYT